MHKTIKKVGEDLSTFQFNTAVSSIMTWLNFLTAKPSLTKEEFETLLKLIAPFAPHISEELYQLENRSDKSLHLEKWPSYQSKYLNQEESQIIVQVNGRLRDTIKVDSSRLTDQAFIEKEAKNSEKVAKYIQPEAVKKVIYVKGKLINFVI